MKCLICGRVLKNKHSKELGYGPRCYKKIFGRSAAKYSVENFPYYAIPGQMHLDDYINMT